MTAVDYASVLDLAAGGLVLAAVLIVWRRDLHWIVRLLAAQGVALAAIPVIRGVHDHDWALVAVGLAVFALIVIGVLTGRLRRMFGGADLDRLQELRD